MWCLWDLGKLCESLYGRWTYLFIYVITGVAGGVASLGWNPGVWSVGASGAIFGLAGALIASFYLGEFSLPQIAIKGTLRSLLFFAGFNLLFGSMFPGIDNSCHVGGLVSGLALGAVIARLAPQQDVPLRRASVVGFVALAVVAAGFGVREWRERSHAHGAPIPGAWWQDRFSSPIGEDCPATAESCASALCFSPSLFDASAVSASRGRIQEGVGIATDESGGPLRSGHDIPE